MCSDDIARYSEVFKALGNKSRLQIVLGLYSDECNVSKIVNCLALPQSTVSQHLALLRSLNIIEGRREGKEICYKVIDKDVIAIIKMLLDS